MNIITPKELVEQEKQKLKDVIKDSVKEFVERTGISIESIEICKINMDDQPLNIALTINLSRMF